MAKVYLDANYFINLLKQKSPVLPIELEQHDLFASPLTFHITAYVHKITIPDADLFDALNKLNIADLTEHILIRALDGPTSDLEDNIQLHTAAEADCDMFLTQDKRLLQMKFFGKTRIANSINPSKRST